MRPGCRSILDRQDRKDPDEAFHKVHYPWVESECVHLVHKLLPLLRISLQERMAPSPARGHGLLKLNGKAAMEGRATSGAACHWRSASTATWISPIM